jgi:hypothetical protein
MNMLYDGYGTMESGHEKYSGKGHHVFLEGTLQGDACMACQKGLVDSAKRCIMSL